MYLNKQSEKLVTKFEYLIGTVYFPFGKGGDEFKIVKLESRLLPRKGSYPDINAEKIRDPDDEKYKSSKNWEVFVLLIGTNGESEETVLEKVLKQKRIQIDFNVLGEN
jgi:hypothetical protein